MGSHTPLHGQQQPTSSGYHGLQQQAWSDPIAPTPEISSPSSPPLPRRVTFFQRAARNGSQASIGLGIAHQDQSRGYSQVGQFSPYDSPPPPLNNTKAPYGLHQHEYYSSTPDTPAFHHSPHNRDLSPDGPDKPLLQPPRWSWGWLNAPWVMYAALLLGIVFAGAHHAFYVSLNGQPADDQLKMMRFGGFLSYASKASLFAAVYFAYRQQVWVTVRRRHLKLKTVDGIFAISQDLTGLFNTEIWRKSKIVIFLAVIMWLFPLVVILTPSSLTVELREEAKPDQCSSVRTLNFQAERTKNWRRADMLYGYPGFSLSLWNCTLPESSEVFDPYNQTFFDYWDGVSPPADLVTKHTAYSGNVVPRENVALETCGRGWNCSYTITFEAPGYKCDELGRGRNMNDKAIKDQGAPFDSSDLIPKGEYAYIADVMSGEYAKPQVETLDGGVPIKKPIPKHLGALRTEPVLWIGHSVRTRPDDTPPPSKKDNPDFQSGYEPVIFRCEHYVTRYTIQFNHTFSSQSTKVVKKEHLKPIIDTVRETANSTVSDGTKDTTIAEPKSNYVLPYPDYENYRLTAAYHALGLGFRQFLKGKIHYIPFPNPVTDATQTRLIDKATHLAVPNLMEAVQTFYENITLSLLSNPQFMIVSWAGEPQTRSGVTAFEKPEDDTSPKYPCVKTRIANSYLYVQRDLWIAYSIAILATIVCVGLGTAALAQNNYHVRDVKVSSVIAATRAPCLEELPWKTSKWGEVPWEIKETKLGYGIISDRESVGTPRIGVGVSRANTGSTEGGVVGNGKVYYGFAPPEVLERTRRETFGPGRARPKGSPFSFKIWEHS
ncbi:hypothetical protein QBC40DRAFT_230201 [Triangularia verruculosa]|uniref:Formylmethionine deformylase-like protein n=1 Tax=Triangularia verruculosa TaxID=2587418 RepID=A0AAN6XFC9_9PEZI|nr:hypothetical protein QBC40DRAFT_230201 [Triangularia verruculosa]